MLTYTHSFSQVVPEIPCWASMPHGFIRGPNLHPKARNKKKRTASTLTFSKNSCELLTASLWHESGTQWKLFRIGACVMTTKLLDNKISTFKIWLSLRFPRRTAFWTISSLPPTAPPPLKTANFIFIVVSPSLTDKNLSNKKTCSDELLDSGSNALVIGF